MSASQAPSSNPTTIYRHQYQAPAYAVDTVDLTFDLDATKTRVLNKMRLRRLPGHPPAPLRLDGQAITLARVLVNGKGCAFKMEEEQLVISEQALPEECFDLEILTTCHPAKNTHLSGLYASGTGLFTQCEAEGFRRITYFLDRPDVMASYTVTLRADKKTYPVLLSNGNLVESGDLEEGRHFVKWVDPHRKPCYLFALVAGNLACRQRRIRSRAGQEHLLEIYAPVENLSQTDHALNSLVAAIDWDEKQFGLSLDLDRFMVVAAPDFNMGAMENKGLNIFNTKYVLARPDTATDADFDDIESVVAHEYFHNWTGNRVTCRSWFELSLKEGLTVFRDQCFSQDQAGNAFGAAVKRIEDVRVLRNTQFAEDAGAMAHPVRPDQYQAIDNFYTATVYEKGAEVVRMMQTLVGGREGFAKGMTLYFARHDGQAVTCEDFLQAQADANPDSLLTHHLEAFKRWYSQAGTPHVQVRGHYEASTQRYTLHCAQSAPSLANLTALAKSEDPSHPPLPHQPWVIPISLGFLAADGQEIPVQPQGQTPLSHPLVVLTQAEESWVFENVPVEPIPSLLGGFSAPVVLQMDYTEAQLHTLLAHDSDPFNRYEASQTLYLNSLIARFNPALDQAINQETLSQTSLAALQAVLHDEHIDPRFKACVFTLPSQTYIAQQVVSRTGQAIDPSRLHACSQQLKHQLAQHFWDDWQKLETQTWQAAVNTTDPMTAKAWRAWLNVIWSYLTLEAVHREDSVWQGRIYERFKNANQMTSRWGALSALVQSHSGLATLALSRFYDRFSKDPLVLDKWFALQAARPEKTTGSPDVLGRVRQLLQHADFSLSNPNRARSVLANFCLANPGAFHRLDAGGYVLWGEYVLTLDASNPQLAARLARALDSWHQLAEPYRRSAHEALKRVAAKSNLSPHVREIVQRALQVA
jgi:aminopeptidase N